MRHFHVFFIFCSVFFNASCNTKSQKQSIEEEISKLQSAPISMPLKKMAYLGNKADSVSYFNDIGYLKFIIYADSMSCTSCTLKEMYQWNSILEKAQSFSTPLKTYFIFAPKKENIRNLYITMKNIMPSIPIFIDTAGIFSQQNPHIPANPMLHTFLLDKQNKVIFIGDPSKDKNLEDIFWKSIEKQEQDKCMPE